MHDKDPNELARDLEHDAVADRREKVGDSQPLPLRGGTSWLVEDGSVRQAVAREATTAPAAAKAIVALAQAVSLRALDLVQRILERAQTAEKKETAFSYNVEVLNALMHIAERADMLADKATVRL